MRILGFSKKWDKLSSDVGFTTFRLPRLDKDWWTGEKVQIVVKPRSKDREYLGIAEIVWKDSVWMHDITSYMAWMDGFDTLAEMMAYLLKSHSKVRLDHEPLNRLLLKWSK
jgi:hypothetical protein